MAKAKKLTVGLLIAAAVVVGGAAPANAATGPCPDGVGGSWDRGVTSTVWSNFYHSKYLHRSTAGNSLGDWRSPSTQAGYWSKISVAATAANNRTYCAKL